MALTQIRLCVLSGVLALGLTGCASLELSSSSGHGSANSAQGSDSTVLSNLFDLARANRAARRAAEAPSQGTALPQVTRAQVEAAGVPLILMQVPERGFDFMAQVAARRDVTHWRAVNGGHGFILVGPGLLSTTFAFGYDQSDADQRATAAALEGRGPRQGYVKTLRALDGEGRVQARSFVCDLVATGPRTLTLAQQDFLTQGFEENCNSSDMTIQNLYWMDGRGLRASEQWINAETGSIRLEKLSN